LKPLRILLQIILPARYSFSYRTNQKRICKEKGDNADN
jgi:hypothetical protein